MEMFTQLRKQFQEIPKIEMSTQDKNVTKPMEMFTQLRKRFQKIHISTMST